MLRCCSSRVTPVEVHPYVYKYVEEFKKDAKFFGVSPTIINDSIDSVVLYPLHPSLLGLYSPINRQIVINSAYSKDPIIMRKVIYHELGHLYGLPHDTGGIMGTGTQLEHIRSMYSNPQNWDLHNAYLFFRIKKNLDKSN